MSNHLRQRTIEGRIIVTVCTVSGSHHVLGLGDELLTERRQYSAAAQCSVDDCYSWRTERLRHPYPPRCSVVGLDDDALWCLQQAF